MFKYKLSQEEMNTYTHKRQLEFEEELERYNDWWFVVSFLTIRNNEKGPFSGCGKMQKVN